MRAVDAKAYYKIEGKAYEVKKDKDVETGTIVYDRRDGQFYMIESQKDADKYSFVAPEYYAVLREV